MAYIEESAHSAEIDEGEVLHEIGRVLEPLEKKRRARALTSSSRSSRKR